MRIIAPMMILIMMTSTLAGCTGGDPDGGGNDEIDMDILNQLIDDNLQDFINNTTITVENHYHNNTTIVNNDNSINNNSGTGFGYNSIYLLDIEFNLSDFISIENIDYRNNTFSYNWSYYDYATNSERTDVFTLSCQVFYVVGANSSNQMNQVSVWQDSSYYYSAWNNLYNSTIRDLLWDARYTYSVDYITGESIESICNENYPQNTAFDDLLVYEIPLPEGVALMGVIDSGYYGAATGLNTYIWTKQCTYMSNSDSSFPYMYTGNFSWEVNYAPDCENTERGHYLQQDSISVSFVYDTIDWSYTYDGWIGGSSDSTLEIYANNIEPNWQYRLVIYFQMANSINNFE